jgi:hypothetical protein
VFDGDEGKLEELYGKLYSLTQFLKEDNFKSYDDLKSKLNRTLTGSGVQGTVEKFTPTPKADKAEAPTTPASSVVDEGEEDTLSYFAKLADDE